MTPFWNGAMLKLLYRIRSRVDAGLILASVGIPCAQVVLVGGLVVQFEIALIRI